MQPFQVLCINSDWTYLSGWNQFIAWFFATKNTDPIFGEVYTIIEVAEVKGVQFYTLAECSYCDEYEAAHFILLSDIDEMEFERQPRKEKI